MVYGSPRWTTTTGPSVLWFSAWGRRCGKSAQKVCTCDNEGGRNTEDGVNSTRAHSFLLTIPSEKHEQLSSRLVLLVSHRALHSASTRVAKMRVMVAEVPPAQRRLKRACLLLGDQCHPQRRRRTSGIFATDVGAGIHLTRPGRWGGWDHGAFQTSLVPRSRCTKANLRLWARDVGRTENSC